MEEARIEVKVVPGAPRDAIVGLAQGVWRIKVAAPPQEGRANEALMGFIALLLGVPRRQVSLVRGKTSRHKVLAITGVNAEMVETRLAESAGP